MLIGVGPPADGLEIIYFENFIMFYICSNCGFGSGSWIGKCPDCGGWNTLKEKPEFAKASSGKKGEAVKKLPSRRYRRLSRQQNHVSQPAFLNLTASLVEALSPAK